MTNNNILGPRARDGIRGFRTLQEALTAEHNREMIRAANERGVPKVFKLGTLGVTGTEASVDQTPKPTPAQTPAGELLQGAGVEVTLPGSEASEAASVLTGTNATEAQAPGYVAEAQTPYSVAI